MTTCETLCKIMDEKGVSVRELKLVTGLSLSTIRRLRREPLAGNLYTWNEVAKALDVTVDDFLGGEKNVR